MNTESNGQSSSAWNFPMAPEPESAPGPRQPPPTIPTSPDAPGRPSLAANDRHGRWERRVRGLLVEAEHRCRPGSCIPTAETAW